MAWLAFALIGHWGIAVGSPYTVYFGGTTASYYDLASNTIVAGNAGLAFSGWYTFDLAYAEHFSSFDNPGSYALTTASSDSGCNVVQESVCATDTGFAAPVITGYSISTPFAPSGGYQLIAGSANLGDYSVVQTYRAYPASYPPSGLDIYYAARFQRQLVQSVDSQSGVNHNEQMEHYFEMYPFAHNNSLLSDPSNLLAMPDLSLAFSGVRNFRFTTFTYSYDCSQGAGCVNLGYAPGSHEWNGILTSLRIVAGEPSATVPEPATLALLGLGLAGLGFSRRKQ